MNARTILEASRRKIQELDWIQGSYQKALGMELHFEGTTAQFWDAKNGSYKQIPISKTDAVCAMGAVELALASKLDLEELGFEIWSDTPDYREVRDLLRASIDKDDVITFDSLPKEEQAYFRSDYNWYVNDMATFSPGRPTLSFERWAEERILDEYDVNFDSVETWNDKDGRTKDEVLALFDRAIELSKAESLTPALA